MIRKYLLLVLFCAFWQVSSAQSFRGGLTFGFNAVQINGDDMGGFNKLGFNAGLFTERKFGQKFGCTLKIGYTGKGSRRVIDDQGMGPGIWDRAVLHYAEIPLLFNYYYKERWQLHAGPVFSALISAKIDRGGGYAKENIFKDTEFAYYAGIGYKASETLRLNVFTSHSLLSVARGNNHSIFQRQPGFINFILSFQACWYVK